MPPLPVDRHLPVRAGAVLEDPPDLFESGAGIQCVDVFLQHLLGVAQHFPHRHQPPAGEIDQAGIVAMALRPPEVFRDDGLHARIQPGMALRMAFEMADQAAEQLRQGQRIVGIGAAIRHPQFQGGEAQRRANRPPQETGVLDGAGLHHPRDVAVVSGLIGEKRRQAGARDFLVGGLPVAHQAGRVAHPERR